MKSRYEGIVLGVVGLAFLSLASGAPAHAGGGTDTGGGGDAQEARVSEIRGDILSWVGQGGYLGLELPHALSFEDYRSRMLAVLAPGAVVVGFVSTRQEQITTNPEERVSVGGTPKTCRGFVSSRDGQPHILCNIERFNATPAAGQYRLVHHEFAGLAGVERNSGAASDYEISDQLTDFLRPETVLRLSLRRQDLNEPLDRMAGKYLVAVRDITWTKWPLWAAIEQTVRPGYARNVTCNLLLRDVGGPITLPAEWSVLVTRTARFDAVGYNVTTLYFDLDPYAEKMVCQSTRARNFFPYDSTPITAFDLAQTYCGQIRIPGIKLSGPCPPQVCNGSGSCPHDGN